MSNLAYVGMVCALCFSACPADAPHRGCRKNCTAWSGRTAPAGGAWYGRSQNNCGRYALNISLYEAHSLSLSGAFHYLPSGCNPHGSLPPSARNPLSLRSYISSFPP